VNVKQLYGRFIGATAVLLLALAPQYPTRYGAVAQLCKPDAEARRCRAKSSRRRITPTSKGHQKH